MAVQRIFLDWNSPCLAQAAKWLVDRYSDQSNIDARHLRVVLPGARAVRRFMELIVEQSDLHGKVLVPPRIITSGSLPEVFYSCENRLASSFERHMAWLQALEKQSSESLLALLPKPPEKNNLHAWFLIALRLESLYADISSGGLNFADVAEHCEKNSATFPDDRWVVLNNIHVQFLQILKKHDLADIYSERMHALEHKRCSYSGEIVLIGTSDLPALTRAMLAQNNGSCFSLIHAPENEIENVRSENYFDEFGCVIPSSWLNFEIPVEDARLEFARGPAEQANKVLIALAALKGETPPEEITIGCCAEEAKPYLVEALKEKGLPLIDAAGFPLDRTEPVVLLKLTARYLTTRSFLDFASLVRLPQMQSALLNTTQLKSTLVQNSGLLTALDEFQQEHLQGLLADVLPGTDKRGRIPTLARDALHELLGDLMGKPRNLSGWAEVVTKVIVNLFGTAPLNPHAQKDALIIAGCSALHDEISKLHSFAPAKDVKISAAEFLHLLLSQLSGSNIDLAGSDAAIELLGWLELQLDDASALMITSLNEGHVPQSVNSDPFLPNSLRSALGLVDNDRRYARDAYALTAILRSRPEVKLFATRLDAQGNPLRPSRLLFSNSGEVVARRIQKFFNNTKEQRAAENDSGITTMSFSPPKPVKRPIAPDKMSVTGFKDYLECPYRFYLKHILKLRSLDDSVLELDSAAAGTLLHAVLTEFGQSPIRDAVSEKTIADFLFTTFESKFCELFGTSPLATVRIQRLQAQARLKAFAGWQAKWRSEGWEIKHAEHVINNGRGMLPMPSGKQMEVQGRIDRVDYHPQRKEWFVFDYKTGDAGNDPLKTHQRQGTWTDLQLPLYHYLLRQTGIAEPIRLGFIILPADLEELREKEALWSETEINSAIASASEVAQQVHDQIFWPPKKLRSTAYDDYKILLPDDFIEAANI